MKILNQYRPPKLLEKEQDELISVIMAAYNLEACIERGFARSANSLIAIWKS